MLFRSNGYTSNSVRLTSFATHDVKLAATNITYQTGTLGRFYVATNVITQTNLFGKGSATANTLGLYYFTCTTNQYRETNSIVDISYHYVATGSSGVPLDTDSDGLADYWEDANGSGTLNSGETKTNDSADWGLKVFITRPKTGGPYP